jgi:hypothetical protein
VISRGFKICAEGVLYLYNENMGQNIETIFNKTKIDYSWSFSDFNQEWDFLVKETHKKFRKADLIKREVLLGLQILLSKLEIKNYYALKKIYCTKRI